MSISNDDAEEDDDLQYAVEDKAYDTWKQFDDLRTELKATKEELAQTKIDLEQAKAALRNLIVTCEKKDQEVLESINEILSLER